MSEIQSECTIEGMHAEGGWEGFTLQTSGHFRLHAEVFRSTYLYPYLYLSKALQHIGWGGKGGQGSRRNREAC